MHGILSPTHTIKFMGSNIIIRFPSLAFTKGHKLHQNIN